MFFVCNVKLYQFLLLTMVLGKVCDLLFYHFILLSPSCQAPNFVLFLHLGYKFGCCISNLEIVTWAFLLLYKFQVSTIVVVIQTWSVVAKFKLQSMMYFEFRQHMHIKFSFWFFLFLMLFLFSLSCFLELLCSSTFHVQ